MLALGHTSKAQQALNSGECYANCSELPLLNFIRVVTSGELTTLTKSGKPTPDQLAIAWNEIFMEYCDLSPSNNQHYVLQVTREIAFLETRIAIIQICINRLVVSYYEPACDILREYDYYHPFTPETMLTDLKNVQAEANNLVVQRDVKKGEYQRYIDSQKGESTKETDFDEILTELSKFQGYHIHSKDITVSEYLGIFNRFKKQNGGKTNDR